MVVPPNTTARVTLPGDDAQPLEVSGNVRTGALLLDKTTGRPVPRNGAADLLGSN